MRKIIDSFQSSAPKILNGSQKEAISTIDIAPVAFKNSLTILTVPEQVTLKIQKKTCPFKGEEGSGHEFLVYHLFTEDATVCPIHNIKFLNEISETYFQRFWMVMAQVREGERYALFFKEYPNINIYNKISVSGRELLIRDKFNKAIFHPAIYVEDFESEKKDDAIQQVELVSKEKILELFLCNRPQPKMNAQDWALYKEALLLPFVNFLNILVIGDSGMLKTEAGKQLAAIGGKMVDAINLTPAGVIGMPIKNAVGGFSFAGGAIFDAKDSVLIVDEIEKMNDIRITRVLNEILSNNSFHYAKGNIKFEEPNFYMSFIGFGNTKTINFKKDELPAFQIQETFKFQSEFLQRMHLVIALRKRTFEYTYASIDATPMLKKYLSNARKIKLKEISPEIRKEIDAFVASYQYKKDDVRFYKKFTDLAQAVAKFNFSNEVKMEHINEAKRLVELERRTLYDLE